MDKDFCTDFDKVGCIVTILLFPLDSGSMLFHPKCIKNVLFLLVSFRFSEKRPLCPQGLCSHFYRVTIAKN